MFYLTYQQKFNEDRTNPRSWWRKKCNPFSQLTLPFRKNMSQSGTESELGWTNSQGLALVLGLETGARRENAGSPNNSSQFIVVREETVLHAQVRDTVVPGLFPSNILYPFLHWYLAYFFSSLPRPTICFFFQVFLLSASTHHYHMPFFSSHKSFQNKKRN